MSCCDYECNQGRDCPMRQVNHSRQAFARYCEASKQPCSQNYQCGAGCVIDLAKLQRPAHVQSVPESLPSRLWWLIPAVSIVGTLIMMGFL